MPRMGRGIFSRVIILDGAGHYLQLPSLTTTQRDALTAVKGMMIWNSTTSAINQYNGSSWGTVGVSDHGALTGLTDDDHTQYLLGSGGGRTVKIASKSADQTLTQSSTTLQDVTEMLFAVGANEVWDFIIYIRINSGTTPDFKYAFAVPSGATINIHSDWTYSSQKSLADGTTPVAVPSLGSDATMRFYGIVINGATAGDVQFQAAQNVADASDTKVLTNSFIIAHKLA